VSEKPFPPSPQRLRRARKEGRFAKSGVLTCSAAVVGGLGGLLAVGPSFVAELQHWTFRLLSQSEHHSTTSHLWSAISLWGRAALVPCSSAATAALVASAIQVGFNLEPSWVVPKWERVDPAQGFKRIFSVDRWTELARALGWTMLMGFATVGWLWGPVKAGLRCTAQPSGCFQSASLGLLTGAFQMSALALTVGVLDWLWARLRFVRDLKMSKAELLQEHKQSEGDPRHKAHRRALHQELARRGPARGLESATALVVNPTHLAVALRYSQSECEAPYVTVKAREQEAQALRRDAEARGIPVVQDIPLARSLIQLEVGETIPEELYQAAAVVLRVAEEKAA